MVYPDAAHGGPYDPYEIDRVGIGPRMSGGMCTYSGDIGKGGDYEYCIIVLPDGLAETYAEHPDMEIIAESEADALMADWRINQGLPEEVLDEVAKAKADLYTAKVNAGLSLSQEEVDDFATLRVAKPTLEPITDIIAKCEAKSTAFNEGKGKS